MVRSWTRFERVVALVLALLASGCGQSEAPSSTRNYDAAGTQLHTETPPSTPRPNLVLVVVDSLRADALEPGMDRMPFLASLAETGTEFENVTAAAPWTLPSMVSLLTGVLPSEHGQFVVYADWHLPQAFTTFPEILHKAYGYETAAFINGPWFERSAASLLQGFAHIQESYSLQDRRGVETWARKRDPSRPFFLLLHSFDAHEPYGRENHPWPPPKARGRSQLEQPVLDPELTAKDLLRICALDVQGRMALGVSRGSSLGGTVQRYRYEGFPNDPDLDLAAELEARYWEGVTWTDGLLRQAHAHLKELGLLENTVFVVTSDHGEAFGEHDNLGHGLFLYDEVTQVPLVVTGPGPWQRGRKIADQVGLVDLLPTFLDVAGCAPLQEIAGRSALELLKGGSWCRAVVTEERLSPANTGRDTDAVRISTRTPAWKYIVTYDMATGEVREEAYRLGRDPEEFFDLGESSGFLPKGHPFDDCACPTVSAVRARVWPDARPTYATEAEAIPYGSAAPHARSRRPQPCGHIE